MINLPRHLSMIIEHNDHKSIYQDLRDYLADKSNHIEDDMFRDADERQRCIDHDSLWMVQWYPDTPVGFSRVYASTLQAAMAFACEIQEAADKERQR